MQHPLLGKASTFFSQVIITPKENTVLSFRGDAAHHVKRFSSGKGVARVSLVVEQYKILPMHRELVQPITTSMTLGPDIPLRE